jgi:hypothetical protein
LHFEVWVAEQVPWGMQRPAAQPPSSGLPTQVVALHGPQTPPRSVESGSIGSSDASEQAPPAGDDAAGEGSSAAAQSPQAIRAEQPAGVNDASHRWTQVSWHTETGVVAPPAIPCSACAGVARLRSVSRLNRSFLVFLISASSLVQVVTFTCLSPTASHLLRTARRDAAPLQAVRSTRGWGRQQSCAMQMPARTHEALVASRPHGQRPSTLHRPGAGPVALELSRGSCRGGRASRRNSSRSRPWCSRSAWRCRRQPWR